MCGENSRNRSRERDSVGSSPRVRGKPSISEKSGVGGGLIPACAGKTGPLRRKYRHSGAHPRVCGENKNRSPNTSPHMGSSPRVRGKLAPTTGETLGYGLIPACAGKTPLFPGKPWQHRAHPRVCGENVEFDARESDEEGSSPRVRGKHREGRFSPSLLGLIPACAGKTTLGKDSRKCSWAHPRVCGENIRQSA